MKRLRSFQLVGLAFFASPYFFAPAMAEAQDMQVKQLAPGVTYHRADRAAQGGENEWTISLGIYRNLAERAPATRCAARLGLDTRAVTFAFPGSASRNYKELLAGRFKSRAAAEAVLAARKPRQSCPTVIRATGQYPSDHSAPMRVHVLSVDPDRFDGELIAARRHLGGEGLGRPSEVVQEQAGLAATNGGFFVMTEADGVVGESAGISVLDGQLRSEATRGRPWVRILNNGRPGVTILHDAPAASPALATSAGARLAVDGVNRLPGRLRNCGALHNEAFAQPVHDISCEPEDELVVLRPGSGIAPGNDGPLLVYTLDKEGRMAPADNPASHSDEAHLLVAIGAKRQALRTLAKRVEQVSFDDGSLTNGMGGTGAFAVNGGPSLISEGRPLRLADRQGWPVHDSRFPLANAIHSFISLRAPRTAIGVRPDGTILLVVIDGWRYRSDQPPPEPMNGGATITELTEIMLSLGASEAINLDGGGSSTMVVGQDVVNIPSDAAGERPVGDSLVLRQRAAEVP